MLPKQLKIAGVRIALTSACFLNAQLNAQTPISMSESECTPGEQYTYYTTDSEGESIRMYATCLFDDDSNRYEWYHSSFNPKSSGND